MADAEKPSPHRPRLSDAGLAPTHEVTALDQFGQSRQIHIPGERPLTIKVDGKEIVTLMTLGSHPEELVLGYLRNQQLMAEIADIASVLVDWDKETAAVTTTHGRGIADLEEKLAKITVSTGCGQGTLFSCTVDKIYELKLPPVSLKQSTVYGLLTGMAKLNRIYRQAGSVHACALCRGDEVLWFVEDVGRHNAADTISGRMWLSGVDGLDKIMFATGRLTSEIVMKAAHMRIPVLISRSGVTQMGLDLAQDLGMIIIGRARGKRFLVYHGGEHVTFDAPPES